MSSLAPVFQVPSPSPGRTTSPKLAAAARQFEALLLETLLGPLERSFSAVPGGSNQAESETYQSMGVQALATGLAATGGLGIASMIVRNYMKNQGIVTGSSSGSGAKVSPSLRR